MNSQITRKFYLSFVMAFAIVGLNTSATAQKTVTPPPDDAPIEELEEWIVEALPKYASYKTRSGSVTVSDASLNGCTLKFTLVRKAGTTTTITEGAKRTVSTLEDEVMLDLQEIGTDNTSLLDHLYPDLQTLELKLRPNETAMEIVVKSSAAEAVRSALIAGGRICSTKTP
jgi:hypothetical protein